MKNQKKKLRINPIHHCNKKIKYLGINLIPGVGDGQGGWCAAVHGVAKSRTWLSDWTELKETKELTQKIIRHWWKKSKMT